MEMLVYAALFVLVSKAYGLEREVRSSSFRLGEDVNMTCGDKTWTKDKIMYIIWTLNLKDKKDKPCVIQRNNDGHNENTCLDHKSLKNSTDGQPILHIPHFSYSDVGNYTCDCPYSGGVSSYLYYVTVTAPPNVSSWTELRGSRRVAVCRAERASPAANISWTFTDNVTMETVREFDGLITVQSSVEVSAREDPHNLSCVVTHPYWDEPRVLVPELRTSHTTSLNQSAVYVTVAISVVFCLALLIWGIKKLHNLRRRQKSSSKSPPDDYVEEVEPYESYVQRVNSIYNSSRDLFA